MTDTTTALAPAQQRQVHRVENIQPMLDSDRFEHFQRASKALMYSSILNPSIRGDSPEQCFSNLMLVFDLSDRWKLPALSIAQCIAIVHDKVVYEGKLITAMLKSVLGFNLDFHYQGERGTPGYRVYVSDRPFAEMTDEQLEALAPDKYPRGWRIIDGCVADWQTFQKNSTKPNPAWTGAASRNQLAYRGAREWTRLYEPAQLLGVYGDDEIDDMTARMDRARDVTPAQPAITSGLSAGFARAQPAEVDAQVEEIDPTTGEVTKPVTPAEASEKPQEPDQAAEAQSEPEQAKKAQAKPRGQKKGDAEAKAAEAAAIQLEQDRARAAEALQQLAGEAYDLGFAGSPMVRGDDLTDDQWRTVHGEWQRGAADGTEQAKADQAADASDDRDGVEADFEGDDDDAPDVDPDSALGAIAEAEPEMVEQAIQDHGDVDFPGDADAIELWRLNLHRLTSWAEIKASLNALGKTADWDQALLNAPSRISDVRRFAWQREAELIKAGEERFDFLNDLTAFRCWIETTQDEDAISGNWQALVRQPIYSSLAKEHQKGLEKAVLARMETIKAGKGT